MGLTPLDTAVEAWGPELPDWVRALAVACGQSTQVRVAEQLGRSGAVVSQILRRKYPADMARIEERVRGVFLDGRVMCPSLGELPVHECQDWRTKARAFVPSNALRARMYRACMGCPLNRKDPAE